MVDLSIAMLVHQRVTSQKKTRKKKVATSAMAVAPAASAAAKSASMSSAGTFWTCRTKRLMQISWKLDEKVMEKHEKMIENAWFRKLKRQLMSTK